MLHWPLTKSHKKFENNGYGFAEFIVPNRLQEFFLAVRMAKDGERKMNYNMPRENVKMQSSPRIKLTFYNIVQCYSINVFKEITFKDLQKFRGTLFRSVLSKNAA